MAPLFTLKESSNRRSRHSVRQQQQLDGIRKIAERLRHQPDSALRRVAEDLRDEFGFDCDHENESQNLAIALASESIRRTLGISLYDQQLVAASCLSNRTIAEMQTGEGKTLAVAPAAIVGGLAGQGVHVVNPNLYLAERDCHQLRPAFELLGMTVGLLPERCPDQEKRQAYGCDITYGTAYEFGFDYLRDQITLRNAATKHPLGQSVLSRLTGENEKAISTLQRKLAFALVDEIDNVLIDDASSPLVLAEATDDVAFDAPVHLLARTLVFNLRPNEDFTFHQSNGRIEFTSIGMEKLHGRNIPVPVKRLFRPWPDYVAQALLAELMFRRDIHYVVSNREVQIVDASTGRIFEDRTWQDGLHQAIQAKEGLTITGEQKVQAQITRQRFYGYYEKLAGLTGTATGCEREFKQVYGLGVSPIPLRVPSQRNVLPLRFFSNREAKFRAITQHVDEIHSSNRPILIGTSSISDSQELGKLLEDQGLPFQILNGVQNTDEAEIVSQAGNMGTITIATNLAGRGTDIKLPQEVKAIGGLHVIAAELHTSRRVDRQLIGRCARQGDPGSAQSFSSAEDELVVQYGSWIGDATKRFANRVGEIQVNVAQRLRRIQASAERIQFSRRVALLRQDSSKGSIFAQ